MVEEPQDAKNALKLYKAMRCFGVATELQGMVEWLESELNRLDVANRHEEVDAMAHRRQGACLVLEKIELMVAGAGKKIDALAQVVY